MGTTFSLDAWPGYVGRVDTGMGRPLSVVGTIIALHKFNVYICFLLVIKLYMPLLMGDYAKMIMMLYLYTNHVNSVFFLWNATWTSLKQIHNISHYLLRVAILLCSSPWCFLAVVTCGHPEVSTHVRIFNKDSHSITNVTWLYGENITYNCNYGYSQISGDMERTCEADGEWSGEVPICVGNYANYILIHLD